MNINEFWKIELISGEIKIVKSHYNHKDLTKELFYEFGSDIRNVKSASYDDVNWFKRDNIIKEI